MISTYLQELWNSRCSLNKIEGFNHTVVNTTLGACGDLLAPKEGPCLPFFIWQCGEIKVINQQKKSDFVCEKCKVKLHAEVEITH